MLKQIMEDMFKFAEKYNTVCNVVVGKETFLEIQKEAHPDRTQPLTFEDYENFGFKARIIGGDVIEGDFDYGYYIVE